MVGLPTERQRLTSIMAAVGRQGKQHSLEEEEEQEQERVLRLNDGHGEAACATLHNAHGPCTHYGTM